MTSQPIGQQSIRFGEDYALDLRPRRLRRGSHVLKLERIPFEILVLLLEHTNETVTRDQIVSRVWGQGVFLDTDNSIRGAIRKLRQVLKDDAQTPRFIQTVTGQGYRFIAPILDPDEASGDRPSEREASAAASSDHNLAPEFDGGLPARRFRFDWARSWSFGCAGDCRDHSRTRRPGRSQLAVGWSRGFARNHVRGRLARSLGMEARVAPANSSGAEDRSGGPAV
jgi:DNA-binding winged helix-turn-helix (wHTH) protein